MVTVIDDKRKIQYYHRQFCRRIDGSFTDDIDCWVGYPGGSYEDTVRYSPEMDVWISVQELETRFWNGFGIGRPKEGKNNSLTGEINFPYEKIDRRIAGAFGQEENGNILVLHRGRIGGGRKGRGKAFFTDNFRGDFVTAIDGDRETDFCFVGELNSQHFREQVANFIKEIHRVKNLEDGQASGTFNDLANFVYTDEQSGQTTTEGNEPVIIERTHGIIVNALARQLEGKGLQIGNDKNRDLFIHNGSQIKTLFEIKTSSSTQCLYAAVGQLLLYSIPINNEVKLIAVLPDRLNEYVTKKFSKLGIEILYYEWDNDGVHFTGVDDIL